MSTHSHPTSSSSSPSRSPLPEPPSCSSSSSSSSSERAISVGAIQVVAPAVEEVRGDDAGKARTGLALLSDRALMGALLGLTSKYVRLRVCSIRTPRWLSFWIRFQF